MWLRFAVAALAAAGAVAHAEPDRAEVYDELDAPVFVTGALVFGGTYGASALAAGTLERSGAHRLFAPVVGPWLAARDWGGCTEPWCSREKALLVADGAIQLLGVLAMVEAIIWPSHHRVVTRTAPFLELYPTSHGFAVVGRF